MNRTFLYFVVKFILCSIFMPDIYSKSHECSKFSDVRIVGGSNTTIEQHPYLVRLMVEMEKEIVAYCGGTIISTRYILTAAHCIVVLNAATVTTVHVRAGSTYSNSGGTVYTSTRLFAHPLYDYITDDYDVGLIDLQTNMNLDGKTTRTIGLPSLGSSVQAGTNVVVTGWGLTSENGNTSKVLMEVTVSTITHALCSRSYNWSSCKNTLSSRMFCAGVPQGGKDSCQGDSGGPAVESATGVQLGVVSWGRGCARPNFPGVYADLTNCEIRQWIQLKTGI